MSTLLKVRRGNVVLQVKPEALDYYLNSGYNLVENGKIVKKAVPITKEELRKAYLEDEDIIKELNAEIERLKAQLKETKKPAKTSTRNSTKKD